MGCAKELPCCWRPGEPKYAWPELILSKNLSQIEIWIPICNIKMSHAGFFFFFFSSFSSWLQHIPMQLELYQNGNNFSKKHIFQSLNEVWRETALISLAGHIKSQLYSWLCKLCCFHGTLIPHSKVFRLQSAAHCFALLCYYETATLWL